MTIIRTLGEYEGNGVQAQKFQFSFRLLPSNLESMNYDDGCYVSH